MPYITPKDQNEELVDCAIMPINHNRRDVGFAMGEAARNGGDIQYMLAVALQVYMEKKGFRYAHMEGVMGALSGALREFQRKIVDPYEAVKEAENGVIYKLPDGLVKY